MGWMDVCANSRWDLFTTANYRGAVNLGSFFVTATGNMLLAPLFSPMLHISGSELSEHELAKQ